ncbi:unnamed protein product, partial [Chrysoparadoxa australica]
MYLNSSSCLGRQEARLRDADPLAQGGSGAEDEEAEDGPGLHEFDLYDGSGTEKMRILDSFALYTLDGKPVPLEALDRVKQGENFVGFGTVVEPLSDDASARLEQLENKMRGKMPSCTPREDSHTAVQLSAMKAVFGDSDDELEGGLDSKKARGEMQQGPVKTSGLKLT